MSFRQILASLTTTPAGRFGGSIQTGRIAPGEDADLVLSGGAPERDIHALASIRYTLRGGKILYSANE